MFIEALMVYIASLSGVFLYKFTKSEVETHYKKLNLVLLILFYTVSASYLIFSYQDINFILLSISLFLMFLLNYIPHRVSWKTDTKSFLDMCMQNIPLGFALNPLTALFMFAYFICEASLFSSKSIKNSLLISAYSMIPFISSVLFNSYYPIPFSVTAGLILFLVLKKTLVFREIWKHENKS
ncbi:MAG: hypothetical protein PHW96_04290 [Candidatus Nanoarchaeia archaeon]|nr:hypothetical protein [Candidatus Nanoarchaeia archaeon]